MAINVSILVVGSFLKLLWPDCKGASDSAGAYRVLLACFRYGVDTPSSANIDIQIRVRGARVDAWRLYDWLA